MCTQSYLQEREYCKILFSAFLSISLSVPHWSMDVTAIVIAASIPSALTGFCFWLIEQKIQKQSKKREDEEKERRQAQEKREAAREQHELLLIQGVGAAIALGEATAKAVQRIPDAHCNGDMHAALEYAAKIKHEQKDFLARQGVEAMHD